MHLEGRENDGAQRLPLAAPFPRAFDLCWKLPHSTTQRRRRGTT